MKFKRRFCDVSKIIALSGDGVGGRSHSNFRIGSLLVLRNGSLFSAVNSYKTHTKLTEFYKYPFFHAEAACILKAGTCNCYKASLYISRVKRDGTLALAKPCKECVKLLNMSKVRHVFYSTENGYESLSV